MKRITKIIPLVIIYFLLSGFYHGHKLPYAASRSKDGTMEISGTPDPVSHHYIAGATEKDFIFGKDTMTLPYCYGFAGKMIMPDSAHTFVRDSATGALRINYKIIHYPDSIPFFLRKGLTLKLSISAKQQKHFDAFKTEVFRAINDTTLGPELWFELNSIEAALKNNDAVSYVTGLKHLKDEWSKIPPGL